LALLWSAATVSAQRRGSATKSAASATINNQPTRFRATIKNKDETTNAASPISSNGF
jgi:hypothetical protein